MPANKPSTATTASAGKQTPSDHPSSLSLRGFGVAHGEQVVLSDVYLEIPRRGVISLVGPTGTGKSTLLRTIAGFNRQSPSVRTWGECDYLGRAPDKDHQPVLVSQNSRLLTSTLLDNLLYQAPERFSATPKQKRTRATESLRQVGLEEYNNKLDCRVVELPLVVQRLVAIARELPNDPELMFVDEPTASLDEADADRILDAVRRQGEQRAVVIVLHNQRETRRLGGLTALLAGGIVQEYQPTEDFFTHPLTEAGRNYCATGTCSEPSPSADPKELSEEMRARLHPAPKEVQVPSEVLGPRGFAWLLPGQLAGTPRPGIVADMDYDLKGLKRVGVTDLFSLTIREVDRSLLSNYEIEVHPYPIPDMGAPSFELAEEICRHIDRLLQQDKTIAVHCRAGLGRTGTILVAYLIWRGQPAMDALEAARRIEPKWVQSDVQVQFLEAFANKLLESNHSAAAG